MITDICHRYSFNSPTIFCLSAINILTQRKGAPLSAQGTVVLAWEMKYNELKKDGFFLQILPTFPRCSY